MFKKDGDYKIFEEAIIKVYEGRCLDGSLDHELLVDARVLWENLGSKQQFADWIKNRIEAAMLVAGEDYSSFRKSMKRASTGGTERKEYILRFDAAKEIAMLEHNEQGKKIRRYFIEAERRYREQRIVRARSKEARRVLTDIIRDLIPESPNKRWAYKQFTDLVYKKITGYNAKQLREMYELPKDANLREAGVFTAQQMKEIVKYEHVIHAFLELGLDYQGVKDVLNNPSEYLPV